MKVKNLILISIVCLMLLLIPNKVLAANKLDITPDFNDGNEYEFFDDNTVRVTKVAKGEKGSYGISSSIPNGVVGSDGKEYKVTNISANALDEITEKQDLCIHAINAPKLETTNFEEFFKNINVIYVPLAVSYTPELNATGYREANGWPKVKIKNYVITQQPDATREVSAGEIRKDMDSLTVRFAIPASGGSLQYAWYFCDENGNIIDEGNPISTEAKFQIPSDLAYNNETNKTKDYYFRCIVGDAGNIQEYSNVAKVTVKPGIYRIYFHYANFGEATPEPIETRVNIERKLETYQMSKIPTETQLENYREGAKFVGWTPNKGKTIIEIDDLSTIVFEKNTELYPVWKTKINIDANGGKFEDGNTIFSTYISNFGDLDQEPSEPKLDGDEIIGVSYDKMGEKLYEGDMLTEETTLYVQWALYRPDLSGEAEVIPQPDEKDDTPKTGNNLPIIENTLCIFLILISTLAIIKKDK